MAQKMLDLVSFKMPKKTYEVSTQTGDLYEFVLCLTNTKMARLYYSESYNEYVLSFNYGSCKKFIITKQMWKVLRNKIGAIDKVLNN